MLSVILVVLVSALLFYLMSRPTKANGGGANAAPPKQSQFTKPYRLGRRMSKANTTAWRRLDRPRRWMAFLRQLNAGRS